MIQRYDFNTFFFRFLKIKNWWTEFVYPLSSSGSNEYSKLTKKPSASSLIRGESFWLFRANSESLLARIFHCYFCEAWSIYTYRHVTWNGYLKSPSLLQPLITYCSWLQRFNWKLCLKMVENSDYEIIFFMYDVE